MWWMGYCPTDKMQRTLEVLPLNVSQLLQGWPGGGSGSGGDGGELAREACPLAAWAAYWTLRTHGIPTER